MGCIHQQKTTKLRRVCTIVILILVLIPSFSVYNLFTSSASFFIMKERFGIVGYKEDVVVPSKFEKLWPTLQNELCPDYNPRYKMGIHLFKAARREMNITEWNVAGENDEWFYNGLSGDFGSGDVGIGGVGFGGLGFGDFDFGDFGDDHVLYEGHDTKVPFEYVKIWKCANDQIRFWLKEHFHPVKQTNNLGSLNSQPCIFTVIRDPISHFLSGYNEVETKCVGQEEKKWCILPIELQNKITYRSFQKSSPERFQAYVYDLLAGPKLGKWWNFKHTNSMTHALTKLNREGKNLTGYLPSIENIAATFPPFLNSICPGALNKTEVNSTMEVFGQHKSSNDPLGTYAVAKSIWNESGSTARALCAIHAMDYACWRDLPGGVPMLCQDVYSSDMFLDIVKFGEKEAIG